MDRLDTMRVFVAVAESGGFAPAARRLGLSAPAATRAIAALEERIGARLLHRTTRIVRLTEAGGRFLADAKRILGELEEAEASAAGAHGEPRGRLTVTAPVMFGTRHVAPVVLEFLRQFPQVTARTLLADRVVDLLEEGIDVAVRIAHLPDSSLSALGVGTVRRIVVASPEYLARRGAPKRPGDLRQHDAIDFSGASAEPSWSFHVDGRIETISPPAQLAVNSAEVAVTAALVGRGLTRVLSYQAAPEVQSGKLKIVLARFEPPPIPIHVVHPEGRRANARVRAFVDFAVARLRADKSLN